MRDPERRRHSQLLAALLVTFTPMGAVFAALPVALRPDQRWTATTDLWFTLAGGVLWWVAYRWSKHGRYEGAALLSATTGIVVIYLSTLMDGDPVDLIYLIIPIIFASVFLHERMVLRLTVASLIPLPFVPLMQPRISYRDLALDPASFLLFGSILALVVARHRTRVEQTRQAALRESESRYRGLFESAFDGIAVHDGGRIIDCSPGLAAMLGEGVPELVGSSITDWVDEPDREPVLRKLLEGKSEPFEVVLNGAGGPIQVEVLLKTQQTEAGTTGLMAARDITGRRDGEEALQSAQRLDSIGLLAGGVAHDFNNILMVILGKASLLADKVGDREDAARDVESIISAGGRARDLTEQLLAYAGRSPKQHVDVDLNDVVTDGLPLLESALPHNVWLDLDLGAQRPVLEGDPALLSQVLMNLVMNSAEAMSDKGGAITIRTGRNAGEVPPDFRSLGSKALPSGDHAYIIVHDSGEGMSPETESRMFDPFFSTKGDGHGLGLAAVAGIVRSHGGAVRVQSAKGSGTSVTVAFPARTSGVLSDLEEADHRQRDRVLVVDDDPSVLETVAEMLEQAGHRYLTASSGLEAVEVCRTRGNELRAVVMDLKMPHMDGEATFHRIRQRSPDLPVLFVSGFSEPETLRDLSGRPDVGFLKKPFGTRDLAVELHRVSEAEEDGAEGVDWPGLTPS